MQIQQLELFAAVVEAGGMTAAAQRFGMSQPAVSRSMRSLERELGVALFRPDGRGIEPTEAGDLVFAHVARLTTGWQELLVDLRRLGGVPTELTIAVPFGTARTLIPVLLRRTASALPETTVRIIESASPDSTVEVASGRIDAALVYPEPGGPGAGATGRVIGTESLHAAGRADLLGADNDDIDLADLVGLPLLLSGPSWSIRRLIDQAFASIAVTPTVKRQVGVSDALLAFALEGEGVAILPYSNVFREGELQSLTVRPISRPRIDRAVAVITGPHLSAVAESAVEMAMVNAATDIAEAVKWSLAA